MFESRDLGNNLKKYSCSQKKNSFLKYESSGGENDLICHMLRQFPEASTINNFIRSQTAGVSRNDRIDLAQRRKKKNNTNLVYINMHFCIILYEYNVLLIFFLRTQTTYLNPSLFFSIQIRIAPSFSIARYRTIVQLSRSNTP